MAESKAETSRQLPEPAAKAAKPRSGSTRASFAPTLVLTVTLALAGVAVLIGAVLLIDHPTKLAPPVLAEQNQDAETLLYVLAFGLVLPLALFAGPRAADAIAARPSRAGLGVLTGLLGATLAAVIMLLKLSATLPWGDGVGVLLIAAAIWWSGAALALVRATRPRPWPTLLRLAGYERGAWALAAILVLGTLLCLTVIRSVSPLAIALGAVAVAGLLATDERLGLLHLPRPWRVATDALIVVVVLLAVPDLLVFRPEEAPGNLLITLETGVIQFHQNFLLGPANEILNGGAMLVDTASQYGVGNIYLLAGWFSLAPIGYGTLGFLSGVLSALVFAAGYCVLRIAGVTQVLAASTIALAVIALVFNDEYPINAIPQDSALRFGLPMIVLLTIVTGQRWQAHGRTAGVAALLVVAVASIWSLEGFAYTIGVFAALACVEARLGPAGFRLRWLARQAILAACACGCAHLLFAALTLAATGQLPDWGQYLAYLRAFLFGRLGDITYDFPRWSPGLAVGAGYIASAAAIVLLILRHPAFVRRERVSVVALAGLTAYGILLYSYFDNRSISSILIDVALPALLAGALWLSLILRSRDHVSRPARRGALAFGASVAVLVLSVAWSAIGDRYPRSALAHAMPGGESLRNAMTRLWNPPPLDPLAPAGLRLLDRYIPGNGRPLVLLDPDLGTEILIESERRNLLPLAAPWQDSFVPSVALPRLRKAIGELRPGQRMLTDHTTIEAFVRLRRHPSMHPLSGPILRQFFGETTDSLAPLQRWALQRIGQRFHLRAIAEDASGLAVVELAPRR